MTAHLPAWFWFAVVILISWGIVGLLQKLSTNYLSAEAALIWLVVGFVILLPLLYPGPSLFNHSDLSLALALLSGALNAVGAWALLAAMKHGGKASVVAPVTALYPLVVVMAAPVIFHESISPLQGLGVVSALTAVILLAA